MIVGGNWWRANEIVIRHLTRQTKARYRSRDKALPRVAQERPCRPPSSRSAGLALRSSDANAHRFLLIHDVELFGHALQRRFHFRQQHVLERLGPPLDAPVLAPEPLEVTGEHPGFERRFEPARESRATLGRLGRVVEGFAGPHVGNPPRLACLDRDAEELREANIRERRRLRRNRMELKRVEAVALDRRRQRRVRRPPPRLHDRLRVLISPCEAQDFGGQNHALLVEKAESLPHERSLLGQRESRASGWRNFSHVRTCARTRYA